MFCKGKNIWRELWREACIRMMNQNLSQVKTKIWKKYFRSKNQAKIILINTIYHLTKTNSIKEVFSIGKKIYAWRKLPEKTISISCHLTFLCTHSLHLLLKCFQMFYLLVTYQNYSILPKLVGFVQIKRMIIKVFFTVWNEGLKLGTYIFPK